MAAVAIAGCGDDEGEGGAPPAEPPAQEEQKAPPEAEDGSGDAAEVEEAVVAYFNALADQDYGQACEQLAPRAREGIERLSREGGDCERTLDRFLSAIPESQRRRVRDVSVSDVRVRGNTATARVEGARQPIPLSKIDGDWKIGRFNVGGR
jgi:hypothetical protein